MDDSNEAKESSDDPVNELESTNEDSIASDNMVDHHDEATADAIDQAEHEGTSPREIPRQGEDTSVDHHQSDFASINVDRSSLKKAPAAIRFLDVDGEPSADLNAGQFYFLGLKQDPLPRFGSKLIKKWDVPIHDSVESIYANLVEAWNQTCPEFPSDRLVPFASQVAAFDFAIRKVRSSERHKVLVVAGADHGSSALGIAAGSHLEKRDAFGPLVAGFWHVSHLDPNLLVEATDEKTAAILLPTQLLADEGQALPNECFQVAAELCDQWDIPLIVDQSRTTVGCNGSLIAHQASVKIDADLVLLSAGLFGSLRGAVAVVRRNGRFQTGDDESTGKSWTKTVDAVSTDAIPLSHPFHAAVLTNVLQEFGDSFDSETIVDAGRQIAIALAESIGDVDVVRDVHAFGFSVCISTDLDAVLCASEMRRHGLYCQPIGSQAICIQWPLGVQPDEVSGVIQGIRDGLLAASRSCEPA